MRIVGGKHKGRAITPPKGRNTRPTSDRAREAMFNVLAHAKAGAYAADKLKGVPEGLRRTHMTPDGDGATFNARAKGLITFRQLNLLHDWPFKGPFDVIFCRNVVIYFDAETKARLVNRYAEMLTPNGVLYLGHSESLLGEHPLLRSEGRTIYRRRS